MHGYAAADRAHSRTYDLVLTRGLPAVAIDLLLVGGLLWLVLAGTGVAGTTARTRWLAISSSAGAVLGGVVPWAMGAPALAGPFLPLGALGGVFVFLAGDLILTRVPGRSVDQGSTRGESQRPNFHAFLLMALGAATVAHFVESQVGIETVTTRLYLWTCAGLVAASGFGWEERRSSARKPHPTRAREWGLVVGLCLATVLFGFMTDTSSPSFPWPLITIGLGAAWFVGAVAVDGGKERDLTGYAVASLSVLLASLVLFVSWVRWAGMPELDASVSLPELVDQVRRLSWTLPVFAASVVGVVLVFGTGLARGRRNGRDLVAAALPALVVVPFAWAFPLASPRADVFMHIGRRHESGGQLSRAAHLYDKAVRGLPAEPVLYTHLARVNMVLAGQQAAGVDERRLAMEAALAATTRARDLRPLDPRFHQALGAVETEAGLHAPDTLSRRLHFERSEQAFEAAVAAGPRMPTTWTAWGQSTLRQGEPGKAAERLERARQLDPRYWPVYPHLGEAYLQLEDWGGARDAYRRAVELRPRRSSSWRGLGTALAQLGDREAAVEAYLGAVESGARDVLTYRNLALMLGELGRFPDAITYAEQALEVAPAAVQADVQRLLDQLRTMAETGVPTDSRRPVGTN